MLIDSHCHLDLRKFDADRADVIQRALHAGVNHILIPGLSEASSRSVVKLATNHPILYAAVGVHPTESSTWIEETKKQLQEIVIHDKAMQESNARQKKIVAIGEIGLDYYWDTDPHELQQNVLREQLHLAGELGLPVIIHFREKGDAPDGSCAADLLEILKAWIDTLRIGKNPLAERPGVLHSFAGSFQTACQVIDMNFYLGITGPITYRKDRQQLVANLPLDHLLIETDAPFLAPAPYRGKRNEPAFVRLIADKIAMINYCSIEETAARTTNNAARLFSWD
jgi:TatD DNase family protein